MLISFKLLFWCVEAVWSGMWEIASVLHLLKFVVAVT